MPHVRITRGGAKFPRADYEMSFPEAGLQRQFHKISMHEGKVCSQFELHHSHGV